MEQVKGNKCSIVYAKSYELTERKKGLEGHDTVGIACITNNMITYSKENIKRAKFPFILQQWSRQVIQS
jgi:hypothetical protein